MTKTNNFNVVSGPAGKHFKIVRRLEVGDFSMTKGIVSQSGNMHSHQFIFLYDNDNWSDGLLRAAIDEITRHVLMLNHTVTVDSIMPYADAIVEDAAKKKFSELLFNINSMLEQQSKRSYADYRQAHTRWLTSDVSVDTNIDEAISILNDSLYILQTRKQIEILEYKIRIMELKKDAPVEIMQSTRNFLNQEIHKQMQVLQNPGIKRNFI